MLSRYLLLLALAAAHFSVQAQRVHRVGESGETEGESAVVTSNGYTMVFFSSVNPTANRANLRYLACRDGGELNVCNLVNSSTIETDLGGADVGLRLDAAVGADGAPIISHLDDDGFLRVSKCSGYSCGPISTNSTILDTGDVTAYGNTSIAVSPLSGNPVVAYYDETNGALEAVICSNTACTFGVPVTIDDSGSDVVGAHNDVMFGSDGNPVFSYHDLTHGSLKVAHCSDPTCSNPPTLHQVDNPPASVGLYTSLATGVDGFPVISYHAADNGRLKLALCGDLTCDSALVVKRILDEPVNAGEAVGLYSRLIVPADGLPTVAYVQVLQSAVRLALARCLESSCSSAPVIKNPHTPSTFSGLLTAMTVGHNGFPMITHYDPLGAQTYLVRCDSAACDALLRNGFEGDDP